MKIKYNERVEQKKTPILFVQMLLANKLRKGVYLQTVKEYYLLGIQRQKSS